MALNQVKSVKQLIEEAKAAELSGPLETASELYEQVIQQDALNEFAYERLMIIYRKLKDSKKEIATLNKAIKAYQDLYKSKKSRSKTITDISRKLNKSFGFTDKKGNAVYEPEPIAGWQKRKATLEKRSKKKK